MSEDIVNQWKKREGYGGPDSFPENELAEFSVGRSNDLAGRDFTLSLSDGRVFDYSIRDLDTLEVSWRGGSGKPMSAAYSAYQPAEKIYFLKHDHPGDPRQTTCLVVDFARDQCVLVHGEIPKPGDASHRIRKSHVGGILGEPRKAGEIQAPPFPTDLVGKRMVAEYSGRYAWGLVYLNKTKVAWLGLKGNPGIADVEEYDANQFGPGLMVVSWAEESETLAAVFFYNMHTRTITGHMWGFSPETGNFIHAPMGGRIVDWAAFGLPTFGVDDIDAVKLEKQRAKDVVLRAHYEVWNRGHYELIEEIYSPDYAAHFICGTEVRGCDGVREFIKAHHRSFPDWTERVVDIIADGDRVVTRYISTGTHEGEFTGIAATGRKIEIAEVSIHKVMNGKIVEQWGFPDGMHHYLQMTR
jgi:steroid delta-isomerase-like uncharacterized protein